MKERQINNRFIDLLNKQQIMVPLILDMWRFEDIKVLFFFKYHLKSFL